MHELLLVTLAKVDALANQQARLRAIAEKSQPPTHVSPDKYTPFDSSSLLLLLYSPPLFNINFCFRSHRRDVFSSSGSQSDSSPISPRTTRRLLRHSLLARSISPDRGKQFNSLFVLNFLNF